MIAVIIFMTEGTDMEAGGGGFPDALHYPANW